MRFDIRANDVESHIKLREIAEKCLIQNHYYEVFINGANKGKEYLIAYHKKGFHTFSIDMAKGTLGL